MKRQTADGENHRGTEAQSNKVAKVQSEKCRRMGEWTKEEGERENWENGKRRRRT
ncbi:hypothetical protein IIC38_19445 [candidate division KSB1 bacterium]|nr:hypothetical protein [candidate division KSB1 bacterium]